MSTLKPKLGPFKVHSHHHLRSFFRREDPHSHHLTSWCRHENKGFAALAETSSDKPIQITRLDETLYRKFSGVED